MAIDPPRPCPAPDFDRKIVIVPSHIPSQILIGCPVPSRPVAIFLACPVVPLSQDNKETFVPLSRKVALSRPVGNPSLKVYKGIVQTADAGSM